MSYNQQKITVTVRESNLANQLFFQKQGFLWIRTLRNHYEDTEEAGYLMMYDLANVMIEGTLKPK